MRESGFLRKELSYNNSMLKRHKSYEQKFVEFLDRYIDDVYNASFNSLNIKRRVEVIRQGFIDYEVILLPVSSYPPHKAAKNNTNSSSTEQTLEQMVIEQLPIFDACQLVLDTWSKEGFESAVQLGHTETKRQRKINKDDVREYRCGLWMSRLKLASIWFIKSSWWLCPLLYIALCLICSRTLRFEPMSWK